MLPHHPRLIGCICLLLMFGGLTALPPEPAAQDRVSILSQSRIAVVAGLVAGQRLAFGGPGGLPEIIQQPTSLVKCEGEFAAFRVIAESDFPLTYAWRKDGVLIGEDAVEFLYEIGAVTDLDEGEYSCDVTNLNGTVESDIATLTVVTDAECDDGLFCSGTETCDAEGLCVAGAEPCADPGLPICIEIDQICVACLADAECGDGVFCNGVETCNAGTGECLPGANVDCSDGVDCTVDSCNEATDSCDQLPDDAFCDDGLLCTGVETCDVELGCQAGTPVPNCCKLDSDCDDGSVCNGIETCVIDSCQAGTPLVCDNGLFCDGMETCDPVFGCEDGPEPDCDDLVVCTHDVCDEISGSCLHLLTPIACDNGLFCDGVEICDAVLDCVPGTPVDCEDGVSCTVDSCNEEADTCDNVPDDALCDNGVFCDGAESCDLVLDCQAGTPRDCDDGVDCTVDSCNIAADLCENFPDDLFCDDGLECTGIETCDAVLDCQPGTPPPDCCKGDLDCDDNNTCNGLETCVEGTCVAGTPPVCNDGVFCNGAEFCDTVLGCQVGPDPDCSDGVDCTVDSCNLGSDVCENLPDDLFCDDGVFCNGEESCDELLDCQGGLPPDCDDGVDCTVDSCNIAADLCENISDDLFCDDGVFCNGEETCDSLVGCQAALPIDCDDGVGCTVDSCNVETDACDNLPDDAFCDDGLFCSGVETCNALFDCLAGTPVDCADGVDCTTDSCNEVTEACDNPPDDAFCDDGLFCSGIETCDALLDCQAGTPLDCADGVDCTTDSCNEVTEACDNLPNDAFCDDGLFCSGIETCDALFDCQAGAPVDCDDGVICTVDGCNENSDGCDNLPDDGFCDNGLFCDGAEICDVILDCQTAVAPGCDDGVDCTFDSCNEAADACDNVPDDALCDDGLVCNGVEFCDALLDCQPGTPIPDCCKVDQDCDDGLFCNGAETCPAGTCVIGSNPCTNPTFPTCNETDDACQVTAGEGFVLSRNADMSTDDRDFSRDDTLYMLLYSDIIDFNDINQTTWELKDIDNVKVKEDFTNNFDGTYTASYDLSNLPSDEIPWHWKGKAKDNGGNQVQRETDINVFPSGTCFSDADCADGTVCSGIETCVSNTCVPGTPLNCDDGLFCTGVETCDPVLGCQAGTPPSCDDGVGCTVDSCNAGTDSCENTPDDASCDDGLFCTGVETCDTELDCQPGTPVPDCCDFDAECSNGEPCDGAEVCVDNSCAAGPPLVCDDGLFCNGLETCEPGVGCMPGEPVPDCCKIDSECDNGNACDGLETCVDNMCVFGDPLECDNGLFCDGPEFCDTELGCQTGPFPCDDGVSCTDEFCDEEADTCDSVENDSLCNDGLVCTGTETCDALKGCQPGTPVPGCCKIDQECQDGDACDGEETCVDNTCVEGTPLVCDNGVFCDGTEICNANFGCLNPGPPSCNDGIDCTIDSCNTVTDSCDHIPDDAFCDDAMFCSGTESCNPLMGCEPGTPIPDCCDLDSECDNADACDGLEVCIDNTCSAGTPLDCDNGAFCDGAEFCDSVLGCQSGPDPCDDGVSCTVDTCDEGADTCDHVADDVLCDDGLECNGPETCDAELDCQSSPPLQDCCDDSADCDDGLFCNGLESCDMEQQCQPGTNPCTDPQLPICDEELDICAPQTVPTTVVLNEILYDPFADDEGNEKIELKNYSDLNVDLSGWQLCVHDQYSGTSSFQGVVLDPGQIFVVHLRSLGQNDADNLHLASFPSSVGGSTLADDTDSVAWFDCTQPGCFTALGENNRIVDFVQWGITGDSPNQSAHEVAADVTRPGGPVWRPAEALDHAPQAEPGRSIAFDGQEGGGNELTFGTDWLILQPTIGSENNCTFDEDCSDGVTCTLDECIGGFCEFSADDQNCVDNGVFCDGPEVCDPVVSCVSAGSPCAAEEFCNETEDRCDECEADGDCSDAAFCNGAETCIDGACTPGIDPCPGQFCNEPLDQCGRGAGDPTILMEVVEVDGVDAGPVPRSEILVAPNSILTVEFFVRDWSPASQELRRYSMMIDSAGYTSGAVGNIYPRDWTTTTDLNDCSSGGPAGVSNDANAFIDLSNCFAAQSEPPGEPDPVGSDLGPWGITSPCTSDQDCLSGEVCASPSIDWVHGGIGLNEVTPNVQSADCDYLFESSLSAVVVGRVSQQDGSEYYLGTVVLEVSSDAEGTFVLCPDDTDVVAPFGDPENTFLRDENDQAIIPVATECATITVTSLLCPHGDLDQSGKVDLDDLICMLDPLNGLPHCSGMDDDVLDIAPCTGDGSLDLRDLMGLLDALADMNPCPPFPCE